MIDPDAKIDDVASLTHRACMQGRAMCSSCSSIVAKIGVLPNFVSSVHFVDFQTVLTSGHNPLQGKMLQGCRRTHCSLSEMAYSALQQIINYLR